MMQTTTPSSFPTAYAPPATYGRPRRGTPDYAARVRSQVARLAALHAASVAAAPPADAKPSPLVLIVAGCDRVRRQVMDGLATGPAVRVVQAATTADALQLLEAERPALLVVDMREREVITAASTVPTVLVVDQVPRSHEIPGNPVALLAQPLNAARVARQVVPLLKTA